ncbi:MAG: hypothetical protein SVX43_23575, partial [Cyanobacteriota bacterium]|nr:hypothetical protein [Cyanobacteriota bacterium]
PPDPEEFPLTPSVLKLLDYGNEVLGEGHHLNLEWAQREIEDYSTAFARVGLVANVVRRYRLYKDKFDSFKDWCERALKRSHVRILQLINAARVCLALAEEGFDILPQCEAQCRPLVQFLSKNRLFSDNELLAEKWREVCDRIPPHLLTADRIREVLGMPPQRQRLSLSPGLKKRLRDRAQQQGLTEEQLIEQLLDELDESKVVEPPSEAELAEWEDDLEDLKSEYDQPVVSESSGDCLVGESLAELNKRQWRQQNRHVYAAYGSGIEKIGRDTS